MVILIFLTPLHSHAQDKTSLNIVPSDKFSFELSLYGMSGFVVSEEDYILGEKSDGENIHIPEGQRFDLIVNQILPDSDEIDVTYSTRLITENLTVDIGLEKLFIYPDWDYYADYYLQRIDQQSGYSPEQSYFVGQSYEEFIIQHSFSNSSEPIGTYEAVQIQENEMRYELSTGVLNYLQIVEVIDADYGSYTVNTIMQRIGYEYIELEDLDLTPFQSDPVLVNFYVMSVFHGLLIVLVLRYLGKRTRT
jgi:hypothetical protein